MKNDYSVVSIILLLFSLLLFAISATLRSARKNGKHSYKRPSERKLRKSVQSRYDRRMQNYSTGRSDICNGDIWNAVDSMSGQRFEYWCAGLLTDFGFQDVRITPGSGDQGVDILATIGDMKYAIQCKRYSSLVGNRPVQEVFAGKTIYQCEVAAVMTNSYFTQSAIEAAEATGVLLWDRKKLQSFQDYRERKKNEDNTGHTKRGSKKRTSKVIK